MPMTINHGVERNDRRIRGLEERTKHVSPRAWQSVGAYLSDQVRQQFVTEGEHFHTPWKPLKPKYLVWKLAHGGSRKILRYNGDLMRSFTSRPMSIERYEGNRATFGSSDRKAVWHQKGTHRHGKQVNPPRPMLVVTREVRAGVKQRLDSYIAGGRT